MKYEVSWSDKYDLTQKLEKIEKISQVILCLSRCDEAHSESIEFLSGEINSLSHDLSRIVSNIKCIGKPPSAFDGDNDAPI